MHNLVGKNVSICNNVTLCSYLCFAALFPIKYSRSLELATVIQSILKNDLQQQHWRACQGKPSICRKELTKGRHTISSGEDVAMPIALIYVITETDRAIPIR